MISQQSTFFLTQVVSIWRQTWEIVRQKNFLSFVFMNFLQIFHMTFHSNFASIFLDVLFPGDAVLTPNVRAAFKGALFLTPQILVLCLGPWLFSRGAAWVVSRGFLVKIGASTILALLTVTPLLTILDPETYAAFLLLYVLFDSAIANASFSTFNLLVSDVIDDDMAKNDRASPLSSSIFGTNALITKPAISLAPMLAIYVLNPFGLDAFKRDPAAFVLDIVALGELQTATRHILWAWPLVVGVLQVLAFAPYDLRNTHNGFVPKHVEE